MIRRKTSSRGAVAEKATGRKRVSSTATVPEQKQTQAIDRKIREKAYYIFESRGYTHGNDWSDWLEAEKLLKAGK